VTPLQKALNQRERDYGEALTQLRDLLDAAPPETERAIETLREAVYLAACLRRLLDGRTLQEIHKAFGAPGDFGYQTLIGDTLYKTYRGEQ
jgi:hypothetical protein